MIMYRVLRRVPTKKYILRQCSAAAPKVKISYDELIAQRQQQAKCSIVVQVNSPKSFAELYNYCVNFGSIVAAQHYTVSNEDEMHYILLQYASQEEAAAAIKATAYNNDMSGVPARSPFVWFRAASKKAAKAAAEAAAKKQITPLELSCINGSKGLSNNDLNDVLRAANSIEQQVLLLHKHTKLNDLGTRLRFLAALQIEQAVAGMFPHANAQPFGSSVNGFGRMGCDLDFILRLDNQVTAAADSQAINTKDSRLVFHTKENLSNGRSQIQRQMQTIGDMLHLFLPGVCNVRRILQARVPILKYHHEHLNLEVDLSMSNLTGFYMSELLYLFGECDERVRPLTFSIRRWAHSCGLTNPSPGRWITNFSLTCLVVFFLQQLKQPILPSINALIKSANQDDMRVTEDGINCTFGRDFKRIRFQTKNKSTVSELLLQFFELYSQFDFQNRAISLNEARAVGKPEHSPMYIINPLEQVLNVSKNVSMEECERLRIEVRNAAWVLESEVENHSLTIDERMQSNWGLLNLFKGSESSIIRPNMFFKPRMVEVSELFESDFNDSIEFKNDNVKQEVKNIKAQARKEINKIRVNTAATAAATVSATAATSNSKGRRSR